MYWNVDDKVWREKRSESWLQLKERLENSTSFSSHDIAVMGHYYLTGECVREEGQWWEPVPLALYFAWHPSDDASIWNNEYLKLKAEALSDEGMLDCIKTSYSLIAQEGGMIIFGGESPKEAVNIFVGRERLLYKMFFCYSPFLTDHLVKHANEFMQNAKGTFINESLYLPDSFAKHDSSLHNYGGFPKEKLDDLSDELTSERYNRIATKTRLSLKQLKRRFAKMADFVVNKLDKVENQELINLTERWIKQVENPKTALEWRELWEVSKANVKKQ
ncbi:hypothetical protein [Algibacillus agarilyticus]|uniref:hypothetical protein n=1 Tax=Algibacillus agarilyticus TaxID=2234133 RepID=UPI000DD06EE6|nr:hypothetical protein [Algibacillus agarilyticus]